MLQQVTDSSQVLTADTLQVKSPQTEYLIGNIIPYTPVKNTPPLEMMTADKGVAELYTIPVRAPGLSVPGSPVNNDFSFGVLSLSLVIFALLAVFGRKSLTDVFSVFNFRRPPELSVTTTSGIFSWNHLLKNFFTLLNISLFATLAVALTGIMPPMPGFAMVKTTALFSVIFLGALLARHLVCIIVAVFTGHETLFREYVAVIYNTWFVAALILSALSSILLFTSAGIPITLITAGSIIIVILLLLRTIRLLNIFIKRHVSLLYFILYLCALEVLPVLIVLKALGVF